MLLREDGPDLGEIRPVAHWNLDPAHTGPVRRGAKEQDLNLAHGLLFLGLRDVAGPDYYLQGAW